MKVYELANKHNMSPKDLILQLGEIGVHVNDHKSMVDPNVINQFEQWLEQKNKKRSKKPVKPISEAVKVEVEEPAHNPDLLIVHKNKVVPKAAEKVEPAQIPIEEKTDAGDSVAKKSVILRPTRSIEQDRVTESIPIHTKFRSDGSARKVKVIAKKSTIEKKPERMMEDKQRAAFEKDERATAFHQPGSMIDQPSPTEPLMAPFGSSFQNTAPVEVAAHSISNTIQEKGAQDFQKGLNPSVEVPLPDGSIAKMPVAEVTSKEDLSQNIALREPEVHTQKKPMDRTSSPTSEKVMDQATSTATMPPHEKKLDKDPSVSPPTGTTGPTTSPPASPHHQKDRPKPSTPQDGKRNDPPPRTPSNPFTRINKGKPEHHPHGSGPHQNQNQNQNTGSPNQQQYNQGQKDRPPYRPPHANNQGNNPFSSLNKKPDDRPNTYNKPGPRPPTGGRPREDGPPSDRPRPDDRGGSTFKRKEFTPGFNKDSNNSPYKGPNKFGKDSGPTSRPAGGKIKVYKGAGTTAPIAQPPDKDRYKAKQEKKKEHRFTRKVDEEKDFLVGNSLNRKREKLKSQPLISKEIEIMENITVGDLARKMNIKASELIAKLISMGMMVTITQTLDTETATLVAEEYGSRVKIISIYDETIIKDEEDKLEYFIERPPVVTILGHVDHGKTKLLDAIRETNVVATEAGGITQHIGAYEVQIKGKKISFIDTPGHEAFTAMRARGAKVTDIAILVVAADDGVMPQTREALNHAKAAEVPIMVVINKIDLPDANPDRIRHQLADLDLNPEEWGGHTMYFEVSALKKINLDSLLEGILLQAEILELKADPTRKATGTVIETRIDIGRGPVATVLIQKGTLRIGDPFVSGIYNGRVRALYNHKGEIIEEAPPSTPVEVLGISGVPDLGDPFQVVENEKVAKQFSTKRQELKRHEEALQSGQGQKVTLDNLFDHIKQGEIKELKIIIKADVLGSSEALADSLEKVSNTEVKIRIIHQAVGGINENDVHLASASNAIIIGFNVHPNSKALLLSDKLKVDIRKYKIIYDAIEDMKLALQGLLTPDEEEVILGVAEIRQLYKISRIGTIAGCFVLRGSIQRNHSVRLIRDGIEVYSGKASSLKRFKDDVSEVKENFECGIMLENFNDIKIGDEVHCFVIKYITPQLPK